MGEKMKILVTVERLLYASFWAKRRADSFADSNSSWM